jgi:hypothetical protein
LLIYGYPGCREGSVTRAVPVTVFSPARPASLKATLTVIGDFTSSAKAYRAISEAPGLITGLFKSRDDEKVIP